MDDEAQAGDLRAMQIVEKMECIRDIRAQTLQLERLKLKLLADFQEAEKEEARLVDYRNELELLHQERMAHVEELRQIHSDINSIENVIKAAESDRNHSFTESWKQYQDYASLRDTIDQERLTIGLDRVPPIQMDEKRLDEEFFKKRNMEWQSKRDGEADGKSDSDGSEPSSLDSFHKSTLYQSMASTSEEHRPGLRSHEPPMKLCQTCQQPIHRNAPICPLCKAKSRSRHPKRAKRKHDQ